MAQRTRNFLFTGPFSNGQRPDENDFNDVWESFINYQDDPITLDGNNNYVFGNAIQINDTAANVPGTIRFNGTIFEFREAAGWQPLGAGGGGAFVPIGGGTNVAYNDGNVGINTGITPTDYKFQVVLANNSTDINTVANRVRIGNAAIYNQSSGSANRRAHFSHHDNANDNNFALRQENTGLVHLNAPTDRDIRLTHNGNIDRILIQATTGDVQISQNLTVSGTASKPGGGSWLATSDERTKKKIKPFKDGLAIIKKIDPIHFQYNGKASTKDGLESIGVSGNKIQKIAPYMISSKRTKLNDKDKEETEILVYDSSALIYIAVNAIKELSTKIEELEAKLTN